MIITDKKIGMHYIFEKISFLSHFITDVNVVFVDDDDELVPDRTYSVSEQMGPVLLDRPVHSQIPRYNLDLSMDYCLVQFLDWTMN